MINIFVGTDLRLKDIIYVNTPLDLFRVCLCDCGEEGYFVSTSLQGPYSSRRTCGAYHIVFGTYICEIINLNKNASDALCS